MVFDLSREIRHTVGICTLAHLLALCDVGPQARHNSMNIEIRAIYF